MSRVIHTESVGNERKKLTKMIVISIRELMQQGAPNSTTKDLAAFIAIALEAVQDTVERTVAPWEKRDYWVKADKFRMEWSWAAPLGKQMKEALVAEDWQEVAMISIKIGEKLNNVEVSPNHRLGKPWVGAWKRMNAKNG